MGSIPPPLDVASLLQSVMLPEIPIPSVAGRGTAAPMTEPAGKRAALPDHVVLSPSGVQAMVVVAVTMAERQAGSLLGAVQALAAQPAGAPPLVVGQLAGQIGTAAQDLGATVQVLTSPSAAAMPDTSRAEPAATPQGLPPSTSSPAAPRPVIEQPPSHAPTPAPSSIQSAPAGKPSGPVPMAQPSPTPDPPSVTHGFSPATAPDRAQPGPPRPLPSVSLHTALARPRTQRPSEPAAPAPAPHPDTVHPALSKAATALQAAIIVLGRAEAATQHRPARAHGPLAATIATRAEPASAAEPPQPATTPEILWCQAQLATALFQVGTVLQRIDPKAGSGALSPLAWLFTGRAGMTSGQAQPAVIGAVLIIIAAFALGGFDFSAARIAAALGAFAGGGWWCWRRATAPRRIALRLRP